MISIVVPAYNEEKAIPLFFNEIEKVSQKIGLEFEYIFVNDGSKDNTLQVLKSLHQDHQNVHYIDFSRNFGKEAALLAGLEQSKGDFVAVMDADLQDPPELLEEMYSLLLTGEYDVVGTRRVTRDGEPAIRSFFARLFYLMINKISSTEMIDGARDFRLMTRQVVASILELKEYNRFSKGIFSWVGYKTKYLEYKNRQRVAGETSWSFWGLLKYSIEGIINFSNAPLQIATYSGILSSLAAVIFIIVIVIRTIVYGDPVSGWPSLVSIVLLVGGMQLFALGIIGQYIGKIYLETKKRPSYIIKEMK
ncbi:glycosyl transferase group 2 family protein [Lactococcus chungangensis CAU 28 = DSM 22330]|uniref:Glycosyl transferase group 2 family protein n=1 Tax=Pseudolactococcus chungangensis CAU 28 = DSM 22330 TaxID=1122154 RepID=A0A1K2HJN2_9LACT|nr:glycosyltransferase family 2 protein [Lactococcus chungangensis]NBK99760.1 glycosyltransferase [Erysipelotrichia bacterium]PCS00860.1 glycosyl transferase group 2 family protein [Lactococcus chungangensis CAU 28 = DSM 22330]SFZ76753.1 Glycosyltransferase involved in cell wall bisynthesis [Lactococcus chungangensis CAU 28 = DSM 22330]